MRTFPAEYLVHFEFLAKPALVSCNVPKFDCVPDFLT